MIAEELFDSTMPKIAMLVSNRHDPDPRVQKEAEALTKAGYSVCIYAYDRLHEISAEKEIINGVEINRIRTQLVPYGKILKTGQTEKIRDGEI